MRRVGVPLASLTLALAACNVLTGVTGLHPCDRSTCGDEEAGVAPDVVVADRASPVLVDGGTTDALAPPDADDGAPIDGADSSIGCQGAADCERVVFVTSQDYLGALGGVAGADAKCQAAANASTFLRIKGHTFVAWISTTATTPALRLTHATKRYLRSDNATVAADWNDLTNGDLQNGIAFDELGGNQSGHSVWTGTNTVGGTFEGIACSDWTSSDVMNKGARGNGGGNGNGWSASGEDVCSSTGRLYCFEK